MSMNLKSPPYLVLVMTCNVTIEYELMFNSLEQTFGKEILSSFERNFVSLLIIIIIVFINPKKHTF